ncbi:zinc finger protein [Phyllosticta citrichinensis]|uniref:RING-type E3 ubiquitin transferase n=1 Tax=Phyllosticta citrichinensis TaxID=1130410 RepID=A0ABR1Y464_9PEZI
MSATVETSATTNVDSTNPGRRRRGRGRAQGVDRSAEDPAPAAGDGSRGRGGRRGGRGRGNNGGRSDNTRTAATEEPANASGPNAHRGNFGSQLTQPPTSQEDIGKKGKKPKQDGEEDPEAEICFICASPVVHQSIAPCNHRTCHICSLRLRALYKNKACAHCRTPSDFVIFTDDANKRFEDFAASELTSTDSNLGIKYESTDICEDTVLLLRYNCPDESCDVACLGWPDLHRHVKSVHHKVMCDLCTRNKKVFTHEHELFTVSELRKHEKFGDDNPGAVDQSGFKGHPECGFCRQRFYGDDELYMHCRDKHERCHICDRRNGGRQPQYYVNYDALEVHFKKDHFMCPDSECLEKKFVVFESEMDLKAHQLEAHPNGLSKDARRDARRVDMSGFNYRSPHEDRGGRQGRGRGRGRDPNAEPLPQSSAQPLRRDELAYQRQMAIQSAQSVTSRTFGGQLTSTPADAFAARPPARAQEPATVTAPRPVAEDAFPSLSSLSIRDGAEPARTASPATETPQEQARRLRHNAVTERASSMLRNDQTKVAGFRNKVSLYKNGSMTAAQLIEGFFALFDTSSAELGKLVKELAEIFEIPGKRDGLLKAWNDWKAINEDYPSLPSASGSGSAASAAGAGGSRVLKLKSSTAQSSRSAVSQKGSWGSAGQGSSSKNTPSPNLFPPLSSNGAASSSRTGQGSSSGWGAASAASSGRPSPMASRASSGTNLATKTEDAFPALPAAKKPTANVFTPGYNGRAVRSINGPAPSVNAWGVGGSSSEAAGAGAAADEATFPGSKKKGNRNKKQTLFHFG